MGHRAVERLAGRLRRFGEAIEQAHDLGHGPGECDEPWSLEFQVEAIEIYRTTVPWEFLIELSSGFRDGCAQMRDRPSGADGDAWLLVRTDFESAAEAIDRAAPLPLVAADVRAGDLDPDPPSVLSYELLGRAISARGAEQLTAAAAEVERSCRDLRSSPLSDEEVVWLESLIAGDKVLDVAVAAGCSERQMHRALAELWRRLGVDGRTEGIALAVAQGWVTVTNH